MGCCECLRVDLSNCNDGIRVNAGLIPGDSYKWIITDKFQNKYSETIIADYLGSLLINADSLPDGFFTQYSGSFDLRVEKAGEPQPMLLSQYFECVEISISGGTDVKSNIGE